jgi:hypothetical protein
VTETPKRGVVQIMKLAVVLMLIVGLVGVVLWLLSERNGRLFSVAERDGELWILRGRDLPMGFAPYKPTDKGLAQTYAPISLDGDSPAELLGISFEDRDLLDQAIFRSLRGSIASRLDSEDPAKLAHALRLLRRLELLGGVTAEQRSQLKELRSKAAYLEGRAQLDEAEVALREAVAKLKIASETRGRYSREAGDLYEKLNGFAENLSRAVRTISPRSDADSKASPPPAEKSGDAPPPESSSSVGEKNSSPDAG